jgi:propionate CoA-transferase
VSKFVSTEYVASLIQDGMSIGLGGFVGNLVPEDIYISIQERYLKTQSPKNLTAFLTSCPGDGVSSGFDHFAEEGLLKRIVGIHYGTCPRILKLIEANKVIAYMLPQGAAAQMLSAAGAKKPRVITQIGVGTYIDPRQEGGKANQLTIDSGEEIVSLINVDGEDYLFYKTVPLDMCFIKGTYADEAGNISFEEEAINTDARALAIAARSNGGKVVVQVKQVVKKGTLNPLDVVLPGFIVDYIVVAKPENHYQTNERGPWKPEYTGAIKIPLDNIEPLPLSERKICARRGAMEIKAGNLVNLGFGVSEGVGVIAGEEGISDKFTFSVESGPLGGIIMGGKAWGTATNFEARFNQAETFDLYDGGVLDVTCLGAAEIDEEGNVNVSKFKGRAVGPGGFIDISQGAKKVIYMGSFTAGGLVEEIVDGKLKIVKEGKVVKFVKKVEQITFAGKRAVKDRQEVLYVTERAVFKLTAEGVTLIEIAPGVDLEKDILAHMEFKPVIDKNLKLMDERLFREEKMGLTI